MISEMSPEERRVQPITPSEIPEAKPEVVVIPDEVIETFNELLAESFSGGEARIVQDVVVGILEQKGFKRREVFDRKWLDVEDMYRNAGWQVEYDNPGWEDTYPATFIFRAPSK